MESAQHLLADGVGTASAGGWSRYSICWRMESAQHLLADGVGTASAGGWNRQIDADPGSHLQM
jgi:uncharacterized protein with FMN-binding domain